MNITKTDADNKVVLSVGGRIDTNTSKEFESVLMQSIDGTTGVVLDFEELDYIGSAGLRALLMGEKKSKQLRSSMSLCNVGENVLAVLEMTGFSDILTIK